MNKALEMEKKITPKGQGFPGLCYMGVTSYRPSFCLLKISTSYNSI